MKKIEAIIRKSKFREVKNALVREGVDNFSYVLVRNVGEASETKIYRGVEYEVSAMERIHLTLIAGADADKLVRLIADHGITGEAGDGRIMVSELSGAYRLISQNEKDEIIDLSK